MNGVDGGQDGAVGLSAVSGARRLGAEQIILMGRHKDRTDLGRDFGGTEQSLHAVLGVVRHGGVISRLGVPQYTRVPMGFDTIMGKASGSTLSAPAPKRPGCGST